MAKTKTSVASATPKLTASDRVAILEGNMGTMLSAIGKLSETVAGIATRLTATPAVSAESATPSTATLPAPPPQPRSAPPGFIWTNMDGTDCLIPADDSGEDNEDSGETDDSPRTGNAALAPAVLVGSTVQTVAPSPGITRPGLTAKTFDFTQYEGSYIDQNGDVKKLQPRMHPDNRQRFLALAEKQLFSFTLNMAGKDSHGGAVGKWVVCDGAETVAKPMIFKKGNDSAGLYAQKLSYDITLPDGSVWRAEGSLTLKIKGRKQ